MMELAGKKICVVSLGCARNVVDSEKILGDMLAAGGRRARLDQAQTVILNTCGFTEEAKRESLEALEELLRRKRNGRLNAVYVAGCLVQRYRKELAAAFPEVDDFGGLADFKTAFPAQARLTAGPTAFVKICEGCANPCTYCAIPYIKGRLRSRPQAAVLKEVRALEAQAVREINIVGQDITLYGLERGTDARGLPLVRLLKALLKHTRIPWIRLLYLHPQRMTDELVDLIAAEPRVCSYVDVPFQHASTRILRLMGRRMTRAEVFALVEKLRRRIPAAAVRTTFIVGFPGETKRDFRELCDAVTHLRFDRMGVFMYSREEGTRAYGLKGQVTARVKRERMDHLMRLQAEVSRRNLRQDVGRRLDVLIETPGRGAGACLTHPEGHVHEGAEAWPSGGIPPQGRKTKRGGAKAVSLWGYIGRSYKDAPEVDGVVRVASRRPLEAGDIVACRITSSSTHDLSGELLP